MEFACEIGIEEDSNNSMKRIEESRELLTEASLVPRGELLLGLDISELNSGICMYEYGKKFTANAVLESKEGDFYEVRLRRELKDCLREIVEGKDFDLILIEDAFEGVNPVVTRKLYAINTAIDELILDGVCSCKKFMRVNNQVWKSWLFSVDREELYKGLADKQRIEACLNLLGVFEPHDDGFQDRYDSCGLILGYLACKDKITHDEYVKSFKKVSMSDIEYGYEEDIEFIKMDAGYGSRDLMTIMIDGKRMSKNLMIQKLSEMPNAIYITRDKIALGMLGDALSIPRVSGGGYFGFWVKENKVKKYIDVDVEDLDERFSKI